MIDHTFSSPRTDPVNNLTPPCSAPALETSPVSSPSTSPASTSLPREQSRQVFVSRELLASEIISSAHNTPRNSIPNSPSNSTEPHTPLQQFVNALNSPPRQTLSPRTHSITSSSTSESLASATCIVCMDQPKDILLAPCQHSHCCLACFRRTRLNACPICRTSVQSVILLSTRLELPVSLIVQRHLTTGGSTSRASVTFGELEYHEPAPYNRSRPIISRRSAPVIPSYPREEVRSMQSRTTSASSIGVARQAESSVRPRPRSQHAAFRRLRETGAASSPSERFSHHYEAPNPSLMLPTSPTPTDVGPHLPNADTPRNPRIRDFENVVLLGHDRMLIMSLAQKLIAAFPSLPSADGHSSFRDKSTFLVNGKTIRLVIVECDPHETAPDLANRIQRQSPKLVLMCADFFNISSFESIVRLDMEVLDYLDLPCAWALVKSLRVRQPRRSHSVEHADVRAAKHFLTSRRRCFLITVDVAQEHATMRKLGYYLYKSAYKSSPSASNDSIVTDQPMPNPRRSWSFLCLRIDLPSKQDGLASRFRQSSMNLANWLR